MPFSFAILWHFIRHSEATEITLMIVLVIIHCIVIATGGTIRADGSL
jgi:hypothetical protein